MTENTKTFVSFIRQMVTIWQVNMVLQLSLIDYARVVGHNSFRLMLQELQQR